MSRAAIEQLLYGLDRAFEGGSGARWHGLTVNLAALEPELWSVAAPGCTRTVLDLVEHVGAAKLVYDSQAFGDGSVHWDQPGLVPVFRDSGGPGEIMEWLRSAQARVRDHVAALDDDEELLLPRMSPQGREQETRWVITTIIEHDLYHAGEINHLRLLHQGNDD